LSITHHTRKRPSTGPRTHRVLNLPLDECIDNTHIVTNDNKRKRKEIENQSLKQVTKSKNKPNQSHSQEKNSENADPSIGSEKGSTPSAKEQKHKAQISNLKISNSLFRTLKALPLQRCNSPWTSELVRAKNTRKCSNSHKTFKIFSRNSSEILPLSKCSRNSPPCWQCTNQGKNVQNATTSFSNIQWAIQSATS